MNKKLLAIAVAGALAAPGVALAQASSVTISGFFKASLQQINYSGANTQPAVGAAVASRLGNSSESRLNDQASRIWFRVNEDLGNGLAAIGQIEQRFNLSTNASPSGNAWAQVAAAGATFVGLKSKTWGQVTFGMHDLMYGKGGDYWNGGGAGTVEGFSAGVFDSIARPIAGNTVAPRSTNNAGLASITRTHQVVRWDAPNWNGFDGTIAWSANPLTLGGGNVSAGGDLGVGLPGTGPNVGQTITRKGNGWYINPAYHGRNWNVQYAYWNAKGDINSAGYNTATVLCINAATGCTGLGAPAVISGQSLIQDDQRADLLAGNITLGSWYVGLSWNRAKTTNVASGLVTGDRSAWSIPVSYTTGPHLIGFNYVRANDSKDVTSVTGANISGNDSGAKLMSLVYQYSLSKRTLLGLTWVQLKNSNNAAYNLFYNSPTAFSGANTNTLTGETVQFVGAQMRHAF